MNRTLALGVLSLAWAGAVLAQDEPAAGRQLADRFEAVSYFAEQERAAWRANGDSLNAINKAHSDAVAALSAENAQRTQTIFAENSAAHKELAAGGLQGSERAAEAERIQAQTAKARAELLAWYGEARRAIDDEHALNRAAQIAATNALVEQLGEQRVATLQRLLNGPVRLDAPPALLLPGDESGSEAPQPMSGVIEDTGQGPMANAGGIDVAGTVDIDTPGDELVANANPDMQRLRERLFNEEAERRRRAEEDAARRDRERRMGWGSGSNDIDYRTLDCDDSDRSIHPGATEVCNYVDDNCNTEVDEGLLAEKYLDRDGDLHGDPGRVLLVCAQTNRDPADAAAGDFLSVVGNDCDDTDPTVWHDCG